MAVSEKQNSIARREHEPTFGVKKVALYGDNGNGGLTRLFANGLQIGTYNFVSMALSAADTVETYTFKTGGAAGTTIATVAIVYTTSARTVISNVTKT